MKLGRGLYKFADGETFEGDWDTNYENSVASGSRIDSKYGV